MEYPCITRNDNEIEMILFNEDTAIILNGIHKGELHDVYPRFRSNYTNITSEYLANTWGVVESKEHAEFIIKLAELHGFSVFMPIGSVNHFIIKDGLSFHNCEKIKSTDLKQITIPLPPKSDINEAGHNLVFAASECKEWPCVNDEVEYAGVKCKVLLSADKDGHIVVDKNGNYANPHIDDVKKPKTPEEALRDDIEYLRMVVACDHFVDKLLQKYNITPKD